MPRVNNIDVDRVAETVRLIREDAKNAKRATRVEGSWILEESDIQFRAELKFERGAYTLEMDLPTFMGGGGSRPGPIHYCVFGLASCFMATLAAIAAEKNITLKKARVAAECRLDFSKTFGVADRPIAESVRFDVELEASAERQALEQLLIEAQDRCPAIYSLKKPVPVEVKLL